SRGECRAQALDRCPRTGSHFSLIPYQWAGSCAACGWQGSRIYLLRFRDRRHRGAPSTRRATTLASRASTPGHVAARRSRLWNLDSKAGCLDRRLCRRRRGRQRISRKNRKSKGGRRESAVRRRLRLRAQAGYEASRQEILELFRSRSHKLGSGPFTLSAWIHIQKLSTRSITCAAE